MSSIDELVKKYVSVRDELSKKRKEFDEYERLTKSQLEIISMEIKEKADELGVDSFKTAYGTAFRQVKDSYRISDWSKYADWMLKMQCVDFVEKRPAKMAVKEFYEESGELPPGIDLFVEVEFQVRRAK